MKFSELQDLLKEKYGIDHLADIARELDVSPQAVSNWKARDNVPYKYVINLRNRFDNQVSNKNTVNDNNDAKSNDFEQKYIYSNYIKEDRITFTDFLLLLSQEMKIIVLIPMIFCVITTFNVLFFVEPVYESTSKIISSTGVTSNQSQAVGLAAQFGLSINTGGGSEPERVYAEILKSRTLARVMLKRKFNTKKYGSQKTLMQILTNPKDQDSENSGKNESLAIKAFIEMINISQDLKTGVYSLKISTFEPELASQVNTVLLEEFDKNQRKFKKDKSSETRQFIEERINDTKEELEFAEESLKNFTDRNRRIQNSPSLLLEQQRLSREVSVLTGVFTTLKQQLETAKIEEVKDSNPIIILDPPEIPLIRSKPKRKLAVIISGLIGLGFGIFIAFIKNYISNNDSEDKKKLKEAKFHFINSINNIIPRLLRKTNTS